MISSIATSLLAATAPALVAISEPRCIGPRMPRSMLTQRLVACCGEYRKQWSLQQSGTILELWANPDTGTWSILKTETNGIACMVGSGFGWRVI